MSSQKAKVDIQVNGQAAENVLESLQGKAKQLKKDLQIALKAGDVKGYNKLKKELSGIHKETRQIKRQMFDVDKVLRNLSGASMRDLQKSQAALNKELNSGSVKRNSTQWKKLTGQLRLVGAEMKKVRAEMIGTQSLSTRLANGFNKYFSMITAGIATFIGLIMGMRKAVDASNEYGASLANLSALTGLVGEELDWLSKRAFNLSASVTDSGIRIATSAKDILDAYTQMGSKKPELLANKEALADVTEQAIYLSLAAKMDLVPATNALAISMNQFNAQAKKAPQFINAIAAGSKVGAGNVLYIAEALENAGTSMDGANLSIETSIGLIETLAPKFSKASKAGINLRNIITKLRSGADEFNPAIVGMEQSLNNLADANLSVTTLTEMFTIRNLNAIQVLIENRKEFVRYTAAVTDSNVAVEQAIINTSTNAAKLEMARTRLNKVSIELGQKLAPALTFSTNSVSYLIKGMLMLSKVFNEYKGLIIANTIIIVGYTLAMNAATIAQKVYTIAVNFGRKAVNLFNLAVSRNPILLLITVLTSVIVSILYFVKKTDEATAAQKKFNDEVERGNDLIKDTKSLEERSKVLDQMNKQQLQTFKNDAKFQLDAITDFEENKLLARKKYLDAVTKLQTLKDTKARYVDIMLQDWEIKEAAKHYQEMEKIVLNANADQLQSYIDKADGLLKVNKSEFTSIKDLKDEISRLVEAKDLINISDKEAIAQAQQIIDAKRAELKLFEELGAATATAKTLEDFIAQNAEEFEAWKLAAEMYRQDKEQWEKEADERYNEAMSEDFEMEDEPFIDDIEINTERTVNLAQAELDVWKNSYEGRLEALDDMLARGILTQTQYEERVYALNQEFLNKKLGKYYAYLDAASQGLQAFSDFSEAKMNRELKQAGDNEIEQERIRVKYAKRDQIVSSGQALIKGAMASMNLWGNNTLPYPAALAFNLVMQGVIAAQTMAQVGIINSQQFSKGRIPVTGNDDGKLYFAEDVGKPKTGIQKGVALISDGGDEMIVDGPTTRNLSINYPEIIEGIKQMSVGAVPQFAEGSYPVSTKEIIKEPFTDPAVLELMLEISKTLKIPSRSYLIPDEQYLKLQKEKQDEYDLFQKKISA